MAQAPTDIQEHGARDLDAQVGQMLAEMEPGRSDAAPSESAAPAAGAESDAGLDTDVERMIADAGAAASAPEPPPAAPDPDTPTSIEELDEQLAQSADAADVELEGDFVPLSEVVQDTPPPPAAPSAPARAEPVAARDDVGAAAGHAADTDPAPPPPARAQTAPARGEQKNSSASRAMSVVATVADAASRPFALRSPRVRQLAGWAGLNMVFLAACVWIYLFIRPAPGVATAHQPPASAETAHNADAGQAKPAKGGAPKATAKKSSGGSH